MNQYRIVLQALQPKNSTGAMVERASLELETCDTPDYAQLRVRELSAHLAYDVVGLEGVINDFQTIVSRTVAGQCRYKIAIVCDMF